MCKYYWSNVLNECHCYFVLFILLGAFRKLSLKVDERVCWRSLEAIIVHSRKCDGLWFASKLVLFGMQPFMSLSLRTTLLSWRYTKWPTPFLLACPFTLLTLAHLCRWLVLWIWSAWNSQKALREVDSILILVDEIILTWAPLKYYRLTNHFSLFFYFLSAIFAPVSCPTWETILSRGKNPSSPWVTNSVWVGNSLKHLNRSPGSFFANPIPETMEVTSPHSW